MTRARGVVGVCCAALAACAAPRPPAKSAAAAPDVDEKLNRIQQLMRRELPPMPTQSLQLDGGMQLTAEAIAPIKVERDDKGVTLRLPIGASEPLVCTVVGDYFRPGELLQRVTGIFTKGAQVLSAQVRSIKVAAGRPAVFVEVAYAQKGPDKVMSVGHLKIMVAPTPPVATVCYLGDLGYAETFERVSLGLLGSLSPSGNPPGRIVVYVYSVRGAVVGYEHRRFWARANGTVRAETIGVTMSQVSDHELIYDDVGYSEEQDPRGYLQSFYYFRNASGSTAEAELSLAGSASYALTGHAKGEVLSATLSPSNNKLLLSELARERLVRDELLSGKRKELTMDAYVPSLKPAALMKERYWRGEKAGEIWNEAGGVATRSEVDPDGTMRRASMDLGGGLMLEINREYYDDKLR